MLDLTSIIADRLRWTGVEDIRAYTGFYPSSASVEWIDDLGRRKVVGTCLRQQYYTICGIDETNPADIAGLLKMHFGNVYHDGIADLLRWSPLFLAAEKRMWRPYEEGRPSVSGRVDLFMLDEETGTPIVGEIKTGGGYFFERNQIKGLKSVPAQPREGDVCQILTYLDFYGKYVVEKGFLYYIDRASCNTSQYLIRMDDDGSAWIQGTNIAEYWRHINIPAIDSRWAHTQACLEAGQLPRRDYCLQFSNDELLVMYEEDELSKTDKGKVKKLIEKGYDEDQPIIEKGDWNCRLCRFRDLCYGKEWDDNFKVGEITSPLKLSPEQARRAVTNDAINESQESVVDIL